MSMSIVRSSIYRVDYPEWADSVLLWGVPLSRLLCQYLMVWKVLQNCLDNSLLGCEIGCGNEVARILKRDSNCQGSALLSCYGSCAFGGFKGNIKDLTICRSVVVTVICILSGWSELKNKVIVRPASNKQL